MDVHKAGMADIDSIQVDATKVTADEQRPVVDAGLGRMAQALTHLPCGAWRSGSGSFRVFLLVARPKTTQHQTPARHMFDTRAVFRRRH